MTHKSDSTADLIIATLAALVAGGVHFFAFRDLLPTGAGIITGGGVAAGAFLTALFFLGRLFGGCDDA